MAPGIFSVLVGIVIHILQCGTTYAAAQAYSSWVVAGVEVVRLHIPHTAHGVNEAVRLVHGDGHCAPIVAEKRQKARLLPGSPLALRALCAALRSISISVTKSKNLVRHIQVGLDPTDHKPHIDICDPLMLPVHLEDQENGGSPAELRRALRCGGHECALCDESQQMVKRDVLHAGGFILWDKSKCLPN